MTTVNIEYKGYTITVGVSGKFYAQRGKDANRLTAPSVDSMKKKIDKLDMFTPFSVLRSSGYGDVENRPVTVTGIKKSPGKYGHKVFEMSDGRTDRVVVLNTPDNVKKLAQLKALRAKNRKLIDELRDAENKLYESIERKLAE